MTAGGFHSLKREEAVAEITAKVVDFDQAEKPAWESRRVRIFRQRDVGVLGAVDYASGNSDRTSVNLEHLIELMPHRPRPQVTP